MNEKIVQEARSWIDTPFKAQGRLKNNGCDCLGLVMGIARNLNLKSKNGVPITVFDTLDYDIKRQNINLSSILDSLLLKSEEISSGNLVLMNFDSIPQHLAITSEHPHYKFGIVHSDLKSNKVVEHGLSPDLLEKIQHIYKFCE